MDSKRDRRTIIAPLGGVAVAMALMLSIPVATSAAGPATAWTRQFGTSGTNVGNAVAVDGARNVYVAGCIFGTLPNGTARVTRTPSCARSDPAGVPHGHASSARAGATAPWPSRSMVVVAGSTNGTFGGQTNKGGWDAFLRAYRH